MNVFLPQRAREQNLGGGWTFTRNLLKASVKLPLAFVSRWQDCDIYFIPGATMADRDEVNEAKKAGRKIILRIDNIPRNSRNRGTGTTRLYDFAQIADEVIYQSEWARRFISPFLKREGVVILNGVDTDIFKPDGPKIEKHGEPQYLYSRYNRDETKRWEDAWYEFQMKYFQNPKAHLWIVGRFSPEHIDYNFDFFGGAERRWKYWGIIENQEEMAKIYRGADYLYVPSDLEACSNVVIEAKLCGTSIIWNGNEKNSTAEILKADNNELTLEAMGNKYLKVFNEALQKV